MPIFRVQINGRHVLARIDGQELLCGFVKNEYVWCGDVDSAKQKALSNLRAKLEEKKSIRLLEGRKPALVVEAAISGYGFWKLFFEEGFVFYRV